MKGGFTNPAGMIRPLLGQIATYYYTQQHKLLRIKIQRTIETSAF